MHSPTDLLQFFVREAQQASYDSHDISSFVFRCIKVCHQHVLQERSLNKRKLTTGKALQYPATFTNKEPSDAPDRAKHAILAYFRNFSDGGKA